MLSSGLPFLPIVLCTILSFHPMYSYVINMSMFDHFLLAHTILLNVASAVSGSYACTWISLAYRPSPNHTTYKLYSSVLYINCFIGTECIQLVCETHWLFSKIVIVQTPATEGSNLFQGLSFAGFTKPTGVATATAAADSSASSSNEVQNVSLPTQVTSSDQTAKRLR